MHALGELMAGVNYDLGGGGGTNCGCASTSKQQ